MNTFDAQLIDAPSAHSDGLGLSLKKKLKRRVKKSLNVKRNLKKVVKTGKKVIRAHEKVHSKLQKKLLPTKVRKAVEKVERDPRFKKLKKGVAVAVAAYYLGPMAAQLFGGAGSAVAGKMAGALGAKGSLGRTVASTVGKHALNAGTKKLAQKQALKYQKTALKEQNAEILAQLQASPVYGPIVANMLAKNVSPADIVQTWQTSDTLQTLAAAGATEMMLPHYAQAYEEAGIPPELAQQLALDQVAQDAATETTKAKNAQTPGWQKAALVGVPLLFAVLGG